MDITGNRYGRLVANRQSGVSKRGLLLWECSCDCGTLTVVAGAALRSGNTKSCGCFRRDTTGDRARTHALTGHPILESYKGAKRRCTSPTHKNYDEYGGRGIEFRFSSFGEFLDTLESSWFPGATLERINNDGHYEVGNVRWATRSEQCRNTRRSVIYTHNGTTQTLTDWATALGISPRTLSERITKWGLSKALSTEKQSCHSQKLLTLNGETLTLNQWQTRLGITRASLLERLRKWPLEKALATPRKKGC